MVLIIWFPTYLLEVHKFDLKRSALLAGLPPLLGGGGRLVGLLAPSVQRLLGSAELTRRVFGVAGTLGAAACLLAATWLHQPLLAVGAIALASLCNDLTLPGAWTTCMGIGGRYVGTLSPG